MKKEHRFFWFLPFAVILLIGFVFITGFAVYEKPLARGRGTKSFNHYTLTFNTAVIGKTAAAIPGDGTYIIIRAHSGNPGSIFVGDEGVTPDKGYQLGAADTLVIDSYFAPNTIYVISNVANQKYSYMIMN